MGSAAHSTSRPLRFGIMCPSTGLSEFARQCIDHATRDGLAEPQLLILDENQPAPTSLGTKIKKSLGLDGNLWYLQSRLFPTSQIPTYRSEPLPTAVPRITCRLERAIVDSAVILTFDLDAGALILVEDASASR